MGAYAVYVKITVAGVGSYYKDQETVLYLLEGFLYCYNGKILFVHFLYLSCRPEHKEMMLIL